MRFALLAAWLGTWPAGWLGAVPAAAEEAASQAAEARALYFRGEGAEVRLAGGATRLPAAAFPCANCHGADTLGGREGATVIPPVGWSRLARATPDRPAYDAAALRRAVSEGIAPGGRPLGAAMPRYDLPAGAAGGLAAFLGTLEAEAQAGIGPAELAFGPPVDPAAREGFEAALAAFNRRGAAHGRRLVVAAADAPAAFDFAAAEAAEALQARMIAAEVEALGRAAAADGHAAVAPAGLAGGAPPLSVTLDPASRAVLLAAATAAADVELAGRPVYARRDALTAEAVAAIASGAGGALTVSDPFPEAAAWARANGLGREGARGYALGLLAIDAAVAAGRGTSRPRLEALVIGQAGREVSVRRMDPG